MVKPSIPEDDLAAISKTFEPGPRDKIAKGPRGEVVAVRKNIVDKHGVVIKSHFGKTLRHNKSFIDNTGQHVAGRKGQKFEDIPKELRERVTWRDSDFI